MKQRCKNLCAFLMVASALWADQAAHACAVCFGDPDSDMAKGATMGVAVLGAIVSAVLAMIAGASLMWIHRSRRLRQSGEI